MPTASLLTGDVRRIDGTTQNLSIYHGQVVLVVNVASQCGLTPQYEGLQKLYESRKDRGLVVLGFPSNDFLGQEPGSDADIAEFCRANYGVTFPMFSKVRVIDPEGEGQPKAEPLFARLTELAAAKLSEQEREVLASSPKHAPGVVASSPSWNFTKYLIDREGRFVERFDPRTQPDDAALLARIDALLETQPPAK